MTGLRTIGIKFTAFAVSALLLFMLLLNTMLNGVQGDTEKYQALFRDVSGLATGDDVRVAGVRVGRVQEIEIVPTGAKVTMDVIKEQPLLSTTKIVMRYQNLLGQRYLALEQSGEQGARLNPGTVIPQSLTNPGFDLTELLNGFRPLFETLNPGDVNKLAGSLVKVLQGEGGTVEQLLQQTTQLTNFLADRDKLFDSVLVNLTPVLNNLAGQGTELRTTVVALKELMNGLAKDRQAIGASIDGVSNLITSTSSLLAEGREPVTNAVKRLRTVAAMLADNRQLLVQAIGKFGTIFESLGRPTSYQSALNIYVCSTWVTALNQQINLAGGQGGPWSKVCQ